MSYGMTDGLTFNTLRRANLKRLPMFRNSRGETVHSSDDGSDWSPAQWLQAAVGELGEYANLRKKVERGDFSLAEARPELGNELADVVIYLDILAAQLGIDLGQAVMSKWNAVSERVGAPIYIDAEDWHWHKRPSITPPEFPKPTAEAPEAAGPDGADEAGEGKMRGHDRADTPDVASFGTGGQQTPASASQARPAFLYEGRE